jgi:hypothetical protein
MALLAHSAAACVCPVDSDEVAIRSSDAIFVGRVVAIDPTIIEIAGPAARMVTFQVEHIWKGDETSQRQLVARGQAGRPCTCCVGFAVGQRWLVLAVKRADESEAAPLYVDVCSKTRHVIESAKTRSDKESEGLKRMLKETEDLIRTLDETFPEHRRPASKDDGHADVPLSR